MRHAISAEDVARRKTTVDVRSRLAVQIREYVGPRLERETGVPGLTLTRRDQPVAATSYLYEPSLCLIVQGRKEIVLGTEAYQYDESLFLLTAVNLPTITEVVEASLGRPYLSVVLKLDLDLAREVITEMDLADPALATVSGGTSGTAMAVGPATAPLFEAVARLVELIATPADIPILSRLIHKELLYRVLTSPTGARLRQIVRLGSQSNRVAGAIRWLREHYDQPLRIEDLAERSGMGVSTLHHHFRSMTAMSPLQFQKHLRLHEARRLLLGDEMDAGNAALRVGYESATQFSREYRRLFGAPPMRDVKALRLTETASLSVEMATL